MKKTWIVSALALFAIIASTSPEARAGLDLSVLGGASLENGAAHDGVSKVAPLIGANALVGITPFTEIGVFYEDNLISDSGNSGHQAFYGGMLRFTLIPLLFLDAQVGVSSINYGDGGGTSDSALSFGGRLGYQFSIAPMTSLSPFVGYRNLPAKYGSVSYDGNTIDFGLMLTFGL